MTQKNLKTGDVLVLTAGSKYYHTLSDEEIRERRQRDADSGRFWDSAGEPIVYSPVCMRTLEESTVVLVTRTRGIEWIGWSRRPKGLVEGLATVSGVPVYVMFVKDKVKSQQ